jgi:hypothetical protein
MVVCGSTRWGFFLKLRMVRQAVKDESLLAQSSLVTLVPFVADVRNNDAGIDEFSASKNYSIV